MPFIRICGAGSLKLDMLTRFNGDLLDADICDFATNSCRFHIDNDVCIHNIFTAISRKNPA